MRVEISHLQFEADGKSYFDDLSLVFDKTKFIGITSPTKMDRLDFLLDMIFGLYLPTKGKVLWDGQEIYYNSHLRNNCYYISSRWMPPLFMRVCDYVDTTNLPPQVVSLFEKHDINPRTKLKQLNARQFFSIYCAQAIASKPKVICIDFFGANFRTSDEPWVFSQLEELKKHSIVILKMDATSSNLKFCDDLYFFERGAISHKINIEEAKEEYVTFKSKEKLSQPWIKIPGIEDQYIARREDIKKIANTSSFKTPNLEDVTKLYLLENYNNGTFKKAS